MNKRSAMTIAAGLVAALLAGAAAFSLSFGNPATPASARGKQAPIVRTIKRTVTIHRKAKGASGGPRVVTLPAPSGSSSGFSGDDEGEFEDDHFEGDDDHFEGDGRSGAGDSEHSGEWSGGDD